MAASRRVWDVVGIGENSVDLVAVVPTFPQPGGALAKLQIRDRKLLCGGQTATAMCTCAALGLRTKYVGVVGTDDNGRRIRDELARRNLDIEDVIVRDGDTRFSIVLVDASTGERVVLWECGPQIRLEDGELPLSAIASARVVHVDNVHEDVAIRAARLARAGGTLVTTDIDHVSGRTDELIASSTHALLAQHVPGPLTGVDDVEGALRRLSRTHRNVVCVTLGAEGALAVEGNHLYRTPAFTVDVVDTTGAGDVFRGAFIYAVLWGLPVDAALRIGSAAAAVSCTRIGAMNGVPTLAEINALLG